MSRRRKIKGEDITHVEKIKQNIKLEKKRKRKEKLKRILKRVFGLILVIILVTIVYIFDKSPYSRISDININGNKVVSTEIIEKHVGIKENDRIIKAVLKSFMINSKIDGVANIDTKMYYTKGLFEVTVEEHPIIAKIEGKKPGYLLNDNIVVDSKENIKGSIPILKKFTKETFQEYPEFSEKLSKINESSFRSISEIEIVKEPLEEIYFKITMNNGYYVFSNINNLLLLDYYPDIVSGIQQGDQKDNRCIYFLDYGHTDDNQSAVAKPCK